MKIQAEVLGVEQAVDFNTMQTTAFVVLEVFGQVVRAPISEQQMEQLTLAAVRHKQLITGEHFEDTRDKSAELPEVTERLADQPERDFSVMSELTDHGQQEDEGGLAGLFDAEEQEKIEKLRQRPPLAVAQHTAIVSHTDHSLPRLPGTGEVDEDGFAPG